MKGMKGTNKMKELIRSRVFISSFIIAYFSYFLVTIWILKIARPGFGVGTVDYGYPFAYCGSACFGESFYPLGLLGNILFAALIGTIVGVFCAYVWKTLASEDFRSKWDL
jgi:hypothetical protein